MLEALDEIEVALSNVVNFIFMFLKDSNHILVKIKPKTKKC